MLPSNFSDRDCGYACKIAALACEVGLDVSGFGYEEQGGGVYFVVDSEGAVIFADYTMKDLYQQIVVYVHGD